MRNLEHITSGFFDESTIVFLAALVGVAFMAVKKGFMRDAPAATSSMIVEIKAGRFKKNNWHLHALIIPIAFVLTGAAWLAKWHWIPNSISTAFWISVIAFSVEWWQRKKGANRTPKESFDSNRDALITDYMGWAAMIVAVIILYGFFEVPESFLS